MVNWIMKNLRVRSRNHSISLCDALLKDKLIVSVTNAVDPAKFSDTSTALYKFSEAPASMCDSSLLPSESQIQERVNVKSFSFLRVLGVGGFGSVYLAQKKDDERLYAIKAIRKSRFRNQKEIESLILESEVLRNDHPYLLHLYWAFTSKDFIYLGALSLSQLFLYSLFWFCFDMSPALFYYLYLSALDYMGGGDLFHHLQNHKTGPPSLPPSLLKHSQTYALSSFLSPSPSRRLSTSHGQVHGRTDPAGPGAPPRMRHYLPRHETRKHSRRLRRPHLFGRLRLVQDPHR